MKTKETLQKIDQWGAKVGAKVGTVSRFEAFIARRFVDFGRRKSGRKSGQLRVSRRLLRVDSLILADHGAAVDLTHGFGAVNVEVLTAVILGWRDSDGGFNLGAPRSIPQSLQDCMDKCDEQFTDDPDRWAACVDVGYEAAD